MSFDYRGDFEPCPTEIVIHDDAITLTEASELIYRVARHPVRLAGALVGEYLAGCAADADLHRPK